jgi:hypothetical protein
VPDPSLLCREAEWRGSEGKRDGYGWTGMLLWWLWSGLACCLVTVDWSDWIEGEGGVA